ncbi:MAG: GGDEF domain-containing protein [Moraxellaceae bacterium]|nr:GGDEF domain-containing protein [Moraxellaceae bacterium]
MSLRIRIILALLATSLASVALVGYVANERLMRKFNELVAADASRAFREDVAAYFAAYGTWEEGQRRESFRAFADRRGARLGRPNPATLPPRDAGGPPQTGEHTVRLGGLSPSAVAPSPSGLVAPPFHFLLFDAAGKVLLPVPPYALGDVVNEADRGKGLPITVYGKTVAWAVPKGRPNYSGLDLGYLSAVREALFYGAGAAAVLAVLLGLLLGTRLTASLRRLTQTIERMQKGQLGLQADVRSRDEIGALADAFNNMSSELARKQEELRSSHSQVEAQAETLRELALRDALTMLYNRRHFDEQVGALCSDRRRGDRPLSIMIGDIDHFKQINDRFSHAVGDEVLRRVGEILRKNTRSSDHVARYGGEEFVIAFADTSLEQAGLICDKLRLAIAGYDWRAVHPELQVTISIGVATLGGGDDLHSLMHVADASLYRAKSTGRNQVCMAA